MRIDFCLDLIFGTFDGKIVANRCTKTISQSLKDYRLESKESSIVARKKYDSVK